LHLGYLQTIKFVLEQTEQLILILGSDRIAPDIKNPWSSEERNQKSSAPRGGVWKSFARKPLVSIASLYFSPQGAGNYTHTRLK
jgi:hypothetical protein